MNTDTKLPDELADALEWWSYHDIEVLHAHESGILMSATHRMTERVRTLLCFRRHDGQGKNGWDAFAEPWQAVRLRNQILSPETIEHFGPLLQLLEP